MVVFDAQFNKIFGSNKVDKFNFSFYAIVNDSILLEFLPVKIYQLFLKLIKIVHLIKCILLLAFTCM